MTPVRGCDLKPLLERYRFKSDCSSKFVDAYRHHCQPVSPVSDLKLAPFHEALTLVLLHSINNDPQVTIEFDGFL